MVPSRRTKGHMLGINTTAFLAADTPWAVYQLNGNIPQWKMLKSPLWSDITKTSWFSAAPTKGMMPLIRR